MRLLRNERVSWLARAGGVLALLLVGGALIAHAESVSIPHSFTAGTKVSAGDVNANFEALRIGIEHNKPAIACFNNTGTDTTLTTGYANLASVSIVVPGAGTVMVTGNGTIKNTHSTSMEGARLNISNVSALGSPFPAGWTNNSGWGGGQYSAPFFVQGSYAVSAAGTNVYYLTGRSEFGNEPISVGLATICAVFAPN